jgi:cell division transport system permease protein
VVVLVAVVALLVGAGAATGVWFVTRPPDVPVHQFTVTILLENDATPEQKAAIEAALPAFKAKGAITFTNRDEAWREMQEMMKDRPDFLESTGKDAMPESFNLETEGRLFDCTGYTTVRHMAGVDEIQVVQHLVNDYAAKITCAAEYARP